MKAKRWFLILNNQQGISAVLIAVCLVMLVGFIALSVDVSHLVVARNELQNAADAGALAGAGDLYLNDGTAVNTNANQIGYDTAVANQSEQIPVEVNWPGGNAGDVQRGHWSFASRTFTPNASTAPVDLWGVTEDELDANPNFINAVRVRTRRQTIQIASWFAGIFGHSGFEGFAEAVAYIGFSGTLKPATAQSPIAICKQSIERCDPPGSTNPDDCWYECNEGRFINDAAGGQDEETGMWTSFEQDIDYSTDPWTDNCSGGTNASEVKPLVDCAAIMGDNGVNPHSLVYGYNMEVNNGQIDAAFNLFYDCWKENYENTYMHMTLPVIDCASDPTTCAPLVGAVEVIVVHVTRQPNYKDLPVTKAPIPDSEDIQKRAGWDAEAVADACAGAENPEQCIWYNFAGTYGLVGADTNPDLGEGDYTAAYQAKTIYFLKSCEDHPPEGVTGGKNFGILAQIPVLVD